MMVSVGVLRSPTLYNYKYCPFAQSFPPTIVYVLKMLYFLIAVCIPVILNGCGWKYTNKQNNYILYFCIIYLQYMIIYNLSLYYHFIITCCTILKKCTGVSIAISIGVKTDSVYAVLFLSLQNTYVITMFIDFL